MIEDATENGEKTSFYESISPIDGKKLSFHMQSQNLLHIDADQQRKKGGYYYSAIQSQNLLRLSPREDSGEQADVSSSEYEGSDVDFQNIDDREREDEMSDLFASSSEADIEAEEAEVEEKENRNLVAAISLYFLEHARNQEKQNQFMREFFEKQSREMAHHLTLLREFLLKSQSLIEHNSRTAQSSTSSHASPQHPAPMTTALEAQQMGNESIHAHIQHNECHQQDAQRASNQQFEDSEIQDDTIGRHHFQQQQPHQHSPARPVSPQPQRLLLPRSAAFKPFSPSPQSIEERKLQSLKWQQKQRQLPPPANETFQFPNEGSPTPTSAYPSGSRKSNSHSKQKRYNELVLFTTLCHVLLFLFVILFFSLTVSLTR
jgi:hypothetical protein